MRNAVLDQIAEVVPKITHQRGYLLSNSKEFLELVDHEDGGKQVVARVPQLDICPM